MSVAMDRDAAIDSALGSLGGKGALRRKTGMSVSRLRAHLIALEQSQPEAIRAEVVARGKQAWIDGLVEALGERAGYCATCERQGYQRWAFRLYAELAKLVGASGDIALTIVNLVGAQPVEARAAVDSQRNAAALAEDRPAMALKLARWLNEYCASEGVTLDSVFARASGAEVVNGNGGAHS